MTQFSLIKQLRTATVVFPLASVLASSVHAENWRIGLNASNIHQDVSLTFSQQRPLSEGFLDYAVHAEFHPFDRYDALGFQVGYGARIPLGENFNLALSFPFSYDNYYEVSLDHFSFSPRLDLTRTFQSGAFLKSYFEASIDGGSINEEVSRTQRLGFSLGMPVDKWNFEASASLGHISFPSAPSHNMFSTSVSISREIDPNWLINFSASATRDLTRVRTEGLVYRSVTDARSVSLSLAKVFENRQLTSYISVDDSRSEFFNFRRSEIGIRFSWSF